MTIRTLAVAALCLLVAPTLTAQNKTVFRCEDPSGRVTYSDEACKGGVALKNDDARSEQERQAAAQVAKRDERLADKLTKQRLAAEKATPAATAHIAHSAAEKAAKDNTGAKKKAAATKAKQLPKDKNAALAKPQS